MTTTRTPVVFIHGLWLHASSWQPWIDAFTDAGYAPVAPGWPGIPDTVEAARANPDSIAGHGIDDVTNHYAAIIRDLPTRPVIIGHSFGGMVTEKLLGQDLGAAGIGIDAAQIKGVLPLPPSALHDQWAIPAPGKPLFEAASANFSPRSPDQVDTKLVEFDDRGHSLTIDHGWRDVADESLSWLAKQGL